MRSNLPLSFNLLLSINLNQDSYNLMFNADILRWSDLTIAPNPYQTAEHSLVVQLLYIKNARAIQCLKLFSNSPFSKF